MSFIDNENKLLQALNKDKLLDIIYRLEGEENDKTANGQQHCASAIRLNCSRNL